MLSIVVLGEEFWDEDLEQFCYPESVTLEFEHSLVSLSKWEAKFHKLFLTPDKKTEEEMVGYVRAMLLTPNVSDDTLNMMSEDNIQALEAYINDPMTGTTFSNLPTPKGQSSERLSTELIYYWMSEFGVPIDAKHWHLNQLFTLIKVHHTKKQKPQKMSQAARARQMAELNAARKAKLGTSG